MEEYVKAEIRWGRAALGDVMQEDASDLAG